MANRSKQKQNQKRQGWQHRSLAASSAPEPPVSLRRWDAARTTRHNASHWCSVNNEGINSALTAGKLATLRSRCAYEAANNGIIEGMIRRYCADVSGAEGPTLQVRTSNKTYADALEMLWWKWTQRMDLRGRLHLPDMLQLWTRSMFLNGEFFAIRVNDDRDSNDIPRLRLQNIDPRRIGGEVSSTGADIFMGIKIDEYTRPLAYFVEGYRDVLIQKIERKEYPAAQVIHGFDEQEPEQLRGVPWLAPVLQDIADIRDYDQAVLDAAKAMANHCISMELTAEGLQAGEMTPVDLGNDVLDIPRDSVFFAPAGYRAVGLPATQPTTNYIDHRRERLQDVGACRGIPMLKLLGNASDHNYSSARLDSQDYWTGIAQYRGWLQRMALDALVLEVASEGGQMGLLPGAPPEDLELVWTWTAAPHVDPTKEANAQETLMGLGLQTFAQGCVALGRDPEQQMEALSDEVAAWESAGIQHPVTRVKLQQDGAGRPPNQTETPAKPQGDDEDDD